MRAHTLIVGGGVMGASIAAHLAARLDPLTEPVVLLERRRFGAGSSGRSGAILRTFYSSRELIGMARDSLRAYASFATASGRGIGFTRCGVLSIAGTGAQSELARRNAALMRECGVELELVDAARMRSIVRGVEVSDTSVGVWEPGGAYVDPQRTVEAFAALARERGATLREGAQVREWVVEQGRATAVVCEGERVEFERVVVAAGPWTGALLAQLGLELPLRALRTEQHFVALPRPRAAELRGESTPEALLDARFALPGEPAPAHPVLLDLERGFYTRCEPARGRTRVGALDHERDAVLEQPDELDEVVSADFQSWARAQLVERLPRYREQPDFGAEAAWYTVTPDSQAMIGACPGHANVFVVSGFSGHGFKLAPSIGEGVAQLLCGAPIAAFDAAFFAPTRFRSGALNWSGSFGL
jgi:glycine/D-amino acid oxidase-like deaminating enzyme